MSTIERFCSMILLYSRPGTGKTHVREQNLTNVQGQCFNYQTIDLIE